MSRISAIIVSFVLISFAIVACASVPAEVRTTLEIKTGGGITGPFFAAFLSPSGRLTVKKESLPFAETESGLTTDTVDIQLTLDEANQLITLARAADDFSLGCDLVGHGTSARMWLKTSGATKEFNCSNAEKWPVGPQTKQLMHVLNHHLPERLHLF